MFYNQAISSLLFLLLFHLWLLLLLFILFNIFLTLFAWLWLLRFIWFFTFFLLLWLFFLNIRYKIGSNEGLKNFRYSKTVFCLVIFQDTAESSFCCTKGSIEHMNIPLFVILNYHKVTSFFFAPHLTPRFLA